MRNTAPPVSTDAYLEGLPPDQKAALQALRATILEVVPNAVEGISYGMPAFRVDGRVACYFAAAKGHCAFYPGGLVDRFLPELEGFSTSKGTIRFQPDRPIPDPLLRRIIADAEDRARVRSRK